MVNSEFEIRPSILVGDTADVYSQRTLTILRNEGINPMVTIEFFAQKEGVFCGVKEARALLTKVLPESGNDGHRRDFRNERGILSDARTFVDLREP